jgi:hypothetical protein
MRSTNWYGRKPLAFVPLDQVLRLAAPRSDNRCMKPPEPSGGQGGGINTVVAERFLKISLVFEIDKYLAEKVAHRVEVKAPARGLRPVRTE